MSGGAKKRATYQDVLDAPRHRVAEVVHGELFVFPRPAGPHCAAASALGMLLGGAFELGRGGPGGWRILDEPELHFGPADAVDILVPDLAGWRRERMPARPTGAFIDTPPDWVCEVISPSTAAIDRADKMPVYAREGVGHTWLVDPIVRSIEVYAPDGARWALEGVHRGTGTIRVAPFGEVELDLRAVFED